MERIRAAACNVQEGCGAAVGQAEQLAGQADPVRIENLVSLLGFYSLSSFGSFSLVLYYYVITTSNYPDYYGCL